jgi:hypothetical protein
MTPDASYRVDQTMVSTGTLVSADRRRRDLCGKQSLIDDEGTRRAVMH